jgi:predicted ferric reductase
MNSSPTRGLIYARWATYGFALLIIFLALLELAGGFSLRGLTIPPRWKPETVTFPLALTLENYFFLFFGLVILIPLEKIKEEKRWKIIFTIICVAAVVFAFAMISEVMAKNYIANAAKTKARLPVFQAILLFASLGQIPIHLFVRRPNLLD